MIRKIRMTVMAVAAAASVNALAAVSAEEAKQLGGPVLTLFGSEKAGNKEGTIPPYGNGEIVKTPPGHERNDYTDPWNDKPLFTITAQNANQYAGKLDAMVEMFKRYPNYRMDIYPSHRTLTFPKFFLDNTQKNVTSCKLAQSGLSLQGCYSGIPFPIPKTGEEVMWNHLLEYAGYLNKCDFEAYVVGRDGIPVLQVRATGRQWYPLFSPDRKTEFVGKDLYWGYSGTSIAPTRRVGEKLLVLDPVDAANVGRRAWQYIPGQRRVKLAPDLAFDTPTPYGGGAISMDETKGFLGSPERYNWKLLGKREKIILYNDFKTNDYKRCPPAVIFTKNFPNPDCLRWELHRVWVVEAKLKPGFRHIFHRRVFYWDEDGYVGGATENYDAGDNLYRLVNVVSYPFYDDTGMDGTAAFNQDMQSGIYAIQGITNSKGLGYYAIPPEKASTLANQFSPETLAGEGLR